MYAVRRIGDILRERGLIGEEHVRLALQTQAVTGERLGQVLCRLGLLGERDLTLSLSAQLGLEMVDLDGIMPDLDLLKRFDRNVCLRGRHFPFAASGGSVQVATSGLPDRDMEQAVVRACGLSPRFFVAEDDKVVTAIYNYFYFLGNPVESQLRRETDALIADRSATASPDGFIRNLLLLAVKRRGSDIHLRPMPGGICVFFRVDGVLSSVLVLPPELKRIITAIKLRADMDIAEQRLPQDGRWTTRLLERDYDIRVSSVVTPYGEALALRLLYLGRTGVSMSALGFLDEDLRLIRRVFEEPSGLVLLTGPTGSGKSTTLTAGLIGQNLLGKNVLTIEDPIEYLVPLARQTEVNQAAGYDFSNAMPYFLRHDPDVILIGETRDEKTAGMAFSAAATGHLVLTTLHSNSAVGAISRLRGLGVDAMSLSESLVCVVSQRLVRTICPVCREACEPESWELEYLGVDAPELHRGAGCDFCSGTGYHGRTLIYEIVLIDRELRQLLERDADLTGIEAVLRARAVRRLFDVGVLKVLAGTTTAAELRRTLGALRC